MGGIVGYVGFLTSRCVQRLRLRASGSWLTAAAHLHSGHQNRAHHPAQSSLAARRRRFLGRKAGVLAQGGRAGSIRRSRQAFPAPEWRNWQTRKIQVLVQVTGWRFKSSLGHFQAAFLCRLTLVVALPDWLAGL